MSISSSRLERALELYCELRRRGGSLHELIAQHPDLANELESFVDGEAASPPPEPLPADFPADFEPLRAVGRGALGVVYEARQRSLGRRVALKMLHDSAALGPTALARFHREAQVLARLEHPGVVRVYAADATARPPWLAMEFVDGVSLAEHLQVLRGQGHHGDSMRRLVATVAQVAEALHHVHRLGIEHRDVKPSNILLRRSDDRAVLTDFGLARESGGPTLTHTGVAAGTPSYMAPERILGTARDFEPRSDVFSLGLTLYECLALRRAFDGVTSQQVLQRILTDDMPELRKVAPGVPAELAAIVHMATEHQPARRYADALQFAEDLQAFIDFRPVRARPISRSRRLLRAIRRRPLRAAGALALASALGVAALFAWRWPELQAAARILRAEQVELELVQGMAVRLRTEAERAYAHFRRASELDPDNEIGALSLCFAVSRFEGAARAIEQLQALLADRPHRERQPEWRRLRAQLLREAGREDEAAPLEQDLGPPKTWLELWMAAAPLLRDESDRETCRRASTLLWQAILVAPRPRLWLHLQYAEVHVVVDDKTIRRAAAEALLQLWPENPRAWGTAAACLLTIDPGRAEELLQRAIDTGSSAPRDMINLGVARILAGRPRKGAETLAQAISSEGLSDAHRQRILEILHQVHEYGLEADSAARWLEREPANVTARRFVARTASHNGDHERALRLFRECIAAAPDNVELRWELTLAMQRNGERIESRELLRQLVVESPSHPRAHESMVIACDELGDVRGKIDELERWVTIAAGDATAWRELAAARLAGDRPEDAERALTAAEQADYLAGGRDAEALTLRSAALEKLGLTDAAIRVRARAAALAPR